MHNDVRQPERQPGDVRDVNRRNQINQIGQQALKRCDWQYRSANSSRTKYTFVPLLLALFLL